MKQYFLVHNLRKDIPAGCVVFLVAVPLCLGIALASGAPLFAGILTGIIGGTVVAAISGSQLSVSGPAAGLTVIVSTAITQLGSYEAFLLSLVLAGIFQMVLGMVKAGSIANYFPSSVIEGMLAAIGIILILKQIPHAVGYDKDFIGDERFLQADQSNTFTSLFYALYKINLGAVIITTSSLLIMLSWPKFKKLAAIPAALIVVINGTLLGYLLKDSTWALDQDQYVHLPEINHIEALGSLLKHPDFSLIATNKNIWMVAFTIAVVASLETLLSLEAVDKIDPMKRTSPSNRELLAQGTGNLISGLLGGLPMTAVIVRSSTNVIAGACTKVSAMVHGLLLLISVLFIANLMNHIPLSCLAAILIITGYKLARMSLFKHMWERGWSQFIPFIATLVAVIVTDLLVGVCIGMLVGFLFILLVNMRVSPVCRVDRSDHIRLALSEHVSFLNKGAIQKALADLPKGAAVIIDGSNTHFIDPDILEVIHDFRDNASEKGFVVQLQKIKDRYPIKLF